ncbi:MAG: hypothetical protein GX671_03485 [Clostridiales bacterium]|nr:hypothetical protein [Clostridiales bacterium]
MSKGSSINLFFPRNDKEYTLLLRKFRLSSLLKRINQESLSLFNNNEQNEPVGIKWTNFTLYTEAYRRPHKQDIVITAWDLVDLAYDAIVATNDYRGSDISTNEELYLLVSTSSARKQRAEAKLIASLPERGGPDFFIYLWGFSGEQFKMQSPGRVLLNSARELYIIIDISKRVKVSDDIEDIVYKEVGTSWKNILMSLFLLWCASYYNMDIMQFYKEFQWDKDFCINDFLRVLERYTASYEDVKHSPLRRQILYTKPYIRTAREGIISINCYLNLFVYEHCILWIVREYYSKKNSRQFTSGFGVLFEEYFKELLETYVEADCYVKIEEGATPRADWKVQLDSYTLLIEQKSTFLRLTAKQQESSIEDIKYFFEQSIIKALKQLESTERELNLTSCIKIILLYEDYLKTEIIEYILPNSGVTDDRNYWLVTIDEMEHLLYLYKNNHSMFIQIMEEKIKREVEKSKDGRSLSQLLFDNGLTVNKHLLQDKFKPYSNSIQDEIMKRSSHHV